MSNTNAGAPSLVCRCGVHERGRLTFGADGHCATCGDPLVICADPRSAEMAAAAISERDGLRSFAAHVGTIVQADPSDLKALEAALKQIILTIGAQRWTVDDVARLDDELREKMSRALDNARAKARQEAAEALATVEAERDALRAELEALRGQQGQPVWRTVESIDIVGAAPGGILVQPEGDFELNAVGSTEEAIYADAVLISEAMKGDLSDDASYDRAAAALLRLRNLALATHAVAEAERIRITAAIRLRAANRRAQMPACETGGGHIDALTAKASECEAIVDWLARGGR